MGVSDMTVDACVRTVAVGSGNGSNSHDVHAEQARESAARYEHATGPEASLADKINALKLLGWRVLTDPSRSIERVLDS